ncbi:MAG: hypothetical protein AAB692_01415 [Patescibacteria group bacterium]
MSLLTRIFGGMAAVAFGILLVMKSEWMLQNFGTISWAEQHLGLNGGSRLFYKLIGIVVIMIGFMLATNLFGGFLQGTLGALFRPGGAR